MFKYCTNVLKIQIQSSYDEDVEEYDDVEREESILLHLELIHEQYSIDYSKSHI